MNFFIFFLFTIYIIKINSFLYKVKSLSYLKKSLRILSSDDSFLHYIYGDSRYLNYYYTTLFLGKNKTSQVYILDTGSSITTSPCDQCISCGNHLNQKYPLENTSKILSCNDKKCKISSNSRCLNNKCSFQISYAEGSKLSGIYVDQEVFFEKINMEPNITNESYSIPIGCTTKETHLFKTQLADGIMGLNNNQNSFVGMLYKLGIIRKNIFSLCLEHDGGYFSIGKIYDEFHYTKDIQYVDLINKNNRNYIINLKYLKIGEDQIDFNNGQAVIDSGTTFTYFPKKKFEEIMNKILDKCKLSKKCGNLQKTTNFGYCVLIKDENELNKIVNEGWGNITFKFDDYEFIWTPKNYYYVYKPSKKEYNVCLGFDEANRGDVLLGTTFMHGFDVIFDKEKDRIGFVEANCNREIDDINEIDINNDFTQTNEISVDKNNIISNISINELINISTYIDENIENNTIEIDNMEINIKNEVNNMDNYIVNLCYCILGIIFILFVMFNVILCWDNYIVIQGRKDDEDIDKFVLDNFKYDNNNGPTSLFNDSI